MTIRVLTIVDLTTLHELAALGEAEGFRFVRRFVDELTVGHIHLDRPCEFFLGATVDSHLVGIGGVTPDPYVQGPHVGRLRHLYVRPDVRGAAIGRALVARLEARAHQCYTLLRLRTDTAAAARFYERLGYTAVIDPAATHQRVLTIDAHTPAT